MQCADNSLYSYHSLDPSRQLMAKNYSQLWKAVASTSDEGKAVRTLAEILLDDTGDKDPNTHWVHGENIESTVNM